MTEKLCPKCGKPMMKIGKARMGRAIFQKWLCGRLSGCGHILKVKIIKEQGK